MPPSIQEEMRQAGKPVLTRVEPGPDNPLRECLSLRDPGVPYHPTFNGLLFKDGCR